MKRDESGGKLRYKSRGDNHRQLRLACYGDEKMATAKWRGGHDVCTLMEFLTEDVCRSNLRAASGSSRPEATARAKTEIWLEGIEMFMRIRDQPGHGGCCAASHQRCSSRRRRQQ